MSRYEWERGEFLLPPAEYTLFKKRWREAWNVLVEFRFQQALRWWENNRKTKRPEYVTDEIQPFFFLYHKSGAFRKFPRKPIRKDFPLATNRQHQFYIDETEASILFIDSTKTIIWEVADNNHSCDTAREHTMGNKFFQLMDLVKWSKKRPGGKIIGNDEYNCTNYEEGGRSNYVKDTWPRPKRDTTSFSPYMSPAHRLNPCGFTARNPQRGFYGRR